MHRPLVEMVSKICYNRDDWSYHSGVTEWVFRDQFTLNMKCRIRRPEPDLTKDLNFAEWGSPFGMRAACRERACRLVGRGQSQHAPEFGNTRVQGAASYGGTVYNSLSGGHQNAEPK